MAQALGVEEEKKGGPVSQDTEASGPGPYTGDKGPIDMQIERDTPIEVKPVAKFSYGQRVRIAALHENYEQYLDHIITVCGWARTTRQQGKDLFFVELNDGSCSSSL